MREPDMTKNKTIVINRRLRAVEQAAGGLVVAVEALRAAVRQAEETIEEACWHDVARQPAVPPPSPVLPPLAAGSPRLLRVKEVANLCGLSRSTIYRLQSLGQFPAGYRISTHAVAWRAEEVDTWIQSRRSTKG
jgi:prophage regulatory protein